MYIEDIKPGVYIKAKHKHTPLILYMHVQSVKGWFITGMYTDTTLFKPMLGTIHLSNYHVEELDDFGIENFFRGELTCESQRS